MEKEAPNRINERITVPQVRVVGDGIEGGSAVMPTSQALRLAREQELDLIEISPKAEPPVVRIADYQKFLYQQKRKAKELKAKTVKVTIKEIRFGPQTDDHDYNFKLRHAQNFIGEGAKVKAYVFFKGRSIVFKEQGEILLLRFAISSRSVAKRSSSLAMVTVSASSSAASCLRTRNVSWTSFISLITQSVVSSKISCIRSAIWSAQSSSSS